MLDLALTAALVCSTSCLEAGHEQPPAAVGDALTLKGRVCTTPPDPNGFPVKVVLVVDQSGSMCISDPPGSQTNSGFCEMSSTVPPGVTEPARVRALRKLLQQFESQPNVEVALVPFETNVRNPGSSFARPDGDLFTRVGRMQAELGKGGDFQGALSYAYSLVASDINFVEQNNPELLPRTRYVVVFVTDGTPFPRCSAIDGLQITADAAHPELTWADSPGAGDFCNHANPQDPDAITGFVGGTDRNQNYQLFGLADQLSALKRQHHVGGVQLNTALLFNEDAIRSCGAICQDLYGQPPTQAHTVASYLLRELAHRGGGVFQEFVNADIQAMSLDGFDYSALTSRNVAKTLLVRAMSWDAGLLNAGGHSSLDSDGDCFGDAFELTHLAEGFRPDQRDSRGCDPLSLRTPWCGCRDTDGDGLSQFEEAYLHTDPLLADTDADGLPDGLEANSGLDPLVPQGEELDSDADGVPDQVELRAGSNPTVADKAFFEQNGYRYTTTVEEQPDGSLCYGFSVSNLRVVPTDASGVNLFKIFLGESPERVPNDYAVWKAACVWAEDGSELTVSNGDFRPLPDLNDPSEYQTRCAGKAP